MTCPALISVTGATKALTCKLAAVLASSPPAGVTALAPHPKAILGRVAHKLLELAGLGRIQADADVEGACRRTFDELIAREDTALAKYTDTIHYVPIARSIPFTRFLEIETAAVMKAARVAREVPWKPPPSSALAPALASVPPPPERSMENAALRLRGRADVWDEQSGRTVIRDYKTGRVRGSDGEIALEIVLQLRLYGLLALAERPGVPVALFVEHGRRDEVAFGEREVRETGEFVEALKASLPSGKETPAAALASVGAHCRYCDWRHACPSYRSEAPSMWLRPSVDQVLALDTWGTVTSTVQATVSNIWSIRLRDAAGRFVSVSELDARRFDFSQSAGRELWLFGLEPRGDTRTPSGAFVHPTNFRELGSAGEQRAFGLCVFCD